MRASGIRALLVALVLLTVTVQVSAQDSAVAENVVAVIRWNNAALPAAYWNWDHSGLDEYLTGTELDRRRADIQRTIEEAAELWFEQKDFAVNSVTFPEPDRAVVDTMETWYEWGSLRGVTVERQWTAPERYEVRLIQGRWYVSDVAILAELPPFQSVAPPPVEAPAAVPQPAPAPAAPPAVAPSQPAPAPTATPAPRPTCCRVCTTGKACGNSCIARNLNCRVGAGCACNGAVAPSLAAVYQDAAPLLADVLALSEEEGSCEDDVALAASPGGWRVLAI